MPGECECPLLLAFLVLCPLSAVPFAHKEAACPHDHLAERSSPGLGFMLGVGVPLRGGTVGCLCTQSAAWLPDK